MKLVHKMLLTMSLIAVVPLSVAGWQIIRINEESQTTNVQTSHLQEASKAALIVDEIFVAHDA